MEQLRVKQPVLIVDLDGTLLQSDMLFESLWSAIARNPLAIFSICVAALKGRSYLKALLAELATVGVESLPYNSSVIDYIRRWRAQGGQTALVTATDATLAGQIANHLGLFDEVHGTTIGRNLKGSVKAAFLRDHYGADNYIYMGDTHADLAAWSTAAKAVAVNPSSRLQRKVAALGVEYEQLRSDGNRVRAYWKALRPHQWLKNTLIFVPMLTAHAIDVSVVSKALLAFAAFSLIASSVYILNDLLDLSADRAHPRKCKRPFASGSAPLSHGSWMFILLLLAGFGLAGTLGPVFVGVLLVYYLTTLAYSLLLKRLLILDVCALAALYTLRILAGAACALLPISVWLLAFSIFLFFSLACVKRQAELVDGAAKGKAKAQGRGYLTDDLPVISMMGLASGYGAVLIMALYIDSPEVKTLYSSPTVLWGICLVLLFWLSRIAIITNRGQMHDDPVVFAMKDRVSYACLAVISVLIVAATCL